MAVNIALLDQVMLNRTLKMFDLASTGTIDTQQQATVMDEVAAFPGSDETQSKVHDSASFNLRQTKKTVNNDPYKATPDKMYSIDFEKNLFLKEIRKHRYLWDT